LICGLTYKHEESVNAESLNGLQATRLEYNLGLVVLCKFYVRVTLSGIAYRFVFFLQAFRLLFTSRCCVGVGGLSPRSVSVV
jgi:VIT1/CCC1 family predicted Fe2+/Mn2+ transporter